MLSESLEREKARPGDGGCGGGTEYGLVVVAAVMESLNPVEGGEDGGGY